MEKFFEPPSRLQVPFCKKNCIHIKTGPFPHPPNDLNSDPNQHNITTEQEVSLMVDCRSKPLSIAQGQFKKVGRGGKILWAPFPPTSSILQKKLHSYKNWPLPPSPKWFEFGPKSAQYHYFLKEGKWKSSENLALLQSVIPWLTSKRILILASCPWGPVTAKGGSMVILPQLGIKFDPCPKGTDVH